MGRPRSKVQLKLIENPTQRNKTYRQRKEGLKKKAYELATLCDVPVLSICINPSTGEIESWPNNDQEAGDIMARYQSLSPEIRNKNKFDLLSFLRGKICKLQSDLKNAHNVQIQRMDAKMKAVTERIQLLESETKAIVATGSLEQERTTYWQELMQDDVGFNYPDKLGMSEYNYGALMDYGLDTFSMNLPDNSNAVFGNNLSMGNADAGTSYSNFGLWDFGLGSMHHRADGLMNGPSTSSVDAQEILKEESWFFETKP